jgi:hypothetical protein
MCIVIDINTFSMVFDEANSNHCNFKPIRDWLQKRQGMVVVGGSKYLEELRHNHRHMKIINELRTAGLAIRVNDSIVDQMENHVKKQTVGTACNDHHIIALLGVSGSSILSSLDAESYPFVKDKSLYPSGSRKVRIYRSVRNKGLLKKCTIDEVKNVLS